MHYGLVLSTMGANSDPATLASLAATAEGAGWHGVFVPDVVEMPGAEPVATSDPWISLAAMAAATSTVRLGPIVAVLPRYRPWHLARMATTLDHLSGGRLVLGIGIGENGDPTFASHIERGNEDVARAKIRAERTDETLAILDGLWSGKPFAFEGEHFTLAEATFRPVPVQQPRIPVWVGWQWPNQRPLQRAARWDGAVPFAVDAAGAYAHVSAEDLATLGERFRERPGGDQVDLVAWFPSFGHDSAFLKEARAMDAAGVTWLLQSLDGERPIAELKAAIAAGPPRP